MLIGKINFINVILDYFQEYFSLIYVFLMILNLIIFSLTVCSRLDTSLDRL